MSRPRHTDGSPTLPVATVRSDALILATIGEQLRVELTRPAYAGLGGDADPLAETLTTLYALRDTPERPDAVAPLLESLSQIIDVVQRMRAVADDPWAARPLNSAPKLDPQGRGDVTTRPLDTLFDLVKAKYTELRALVDEPEPSED